MRSTPSPLILPQKVTVYQSGHQLGRRQSGWRKRYRREISLSRPATSPGMRVRQPWRDARCLVYTWGADKFAGLERRRSSNPKPICCWGSAWSSPWPPRACARWRAADPMRKPPGEKYEATLELLREPRLLAQPSTAFRVIPPVHRTNLQGAVRSNSPFRQAVGGCPVIAHSRHCIAISPKGRNPPSRDVRLDGHGYFFTTAV